MKKIYFFILIFLFISSVIYYLLQTDNIVYFASQKYPLDTNHIYLLKKNDGNNQIPSGVVYVIVPLNNKDAHIDFGASGAVIGSSDINLESYVDKKIKIRGYHYDGAPLIIKPSRLPSYYKSNKMAVIHITSIETTFK